MSIRISENLFIHMVLPPSKGRISQKGENSNSPFKKRKVIGLYLPTFDLLGAKLVNYPDMALLTLHKIGSSKAMFFRVLRFFLLTLWVFEINISPAFSAFDSGYEPLTLFGSELLFQLS